MKSGQIYNITSMTQGIYIIGDTVPVHSISKTAMSLILVKHEKIFKQLLSLIEIDVSMHFLAAVVARSIKWVHFTNLLKNFG